MKYQFFLFLHYFDFVFGFSFSFLFFFLICVGIKSFWESAKSYGSSSTHTHKNLMFMHTVQTAYHYPVY